MWMQQQEDAYLRSLPSHNPQQQTFHPGIVTDNRAQQQSHHHHHHHHHHRSTMDLSLPSNPRASRNMAEKQRRDNLNTNISAMATLLPTVAESPRKMDKISILRLAAAFLRMQRALGRGSADFLPRELGDLDLEHYIIDNMIESGGFFIVTTTSGKIVYVSRQVEQHLGHARTELLGQSLYSFVHADDHDRLTKNITPDEMEATVSSTTAQITEVTNDNSNSSEDLTSPRKKMPFREQRRSFELRMLQRSVSRREHTQYEFLDISGILRLADACKSSEANGGRTSHREVNSTSNDIVFVGLARLLKKRSITELSIIDANKDEYVTRHLVDGRIIYCDHRVSVVAGYLSEEVSGLSAFSFMHKDDFRWPMIGLRQMYDRAETCGSSCYRLLSKTGDFIYLRTHGYLEYDKNTQTVESFVCVNTLVSEEEGIELVREMKKRYSATVSETARAMIQSGEEMSYDLDSDSQLSNSKSSLEDPSQLEDAITHLISDLPSPAISEDRLSPSPLPNAQFAKAAIVAQRLPAVSTQASKVGIKKIDHYLILQGKGNRTPKQEAKVDNSKQSQPSGNSKIDHSRAIEHQPLNDEQARHKLTEQESPRPSGKSTTTIPKASSQSHKVQDDTKKDTIPRQINILSPIDPAVETCLNISNDPGTSQLDDPCDGNILNTGTPVNGVIKDLASSTALHDNNPCELKLDHTIDILKRYDDQEPVMGYMENGVIDNGMVSDTETKSHYSLKRICSDEDIRTSCNKKRHSDVHRTSNDTNDEHQAGTYINCRSFERDEEFSGIANDFQYNDINCHPLKVADSHHSSINKVNQQLHPSIPLVVSNANDEQFVGQRDFKSDPLLGPGLDANPDVIMKIFDDLMSGRIFNKTFNGTKVQQLGDNNAINNEIKWTHLQLANSIALQESQLNVLARDLEDPALHAQREDFTELKAEHNMQKQILQTLQQDHHNM